MDKEEALKVAFEEGFKKESQAEPGITAALGALPIGGAIGSGIYTGTQSEKGGFGTGLATFGGNVAGGIAGMPLGPLGVLGGSSLGSYLAGHGMGAYEEADDESSQPSTDESGETSPSTDTDDNDSKEAQVENPGQAQGYTKPILETIGGVGGGGAGALAGLAAGRGRGILAPILGASFGAGAGSGVGHLLGKLTGDQSPPPRTRKRIRQLQRRGYDVSPKE
jgi:hypothetical protein